MARRPKELIRGIRLPFTFTYGGMSYTLEQGKPAPFAYFSYSGAYVFVRGWLCDWVSEQSNRRGLLASYSPEEVRSLLLHELRTYSSASPPSFRIYESATRDLPDEAIREIVADLALRRYDVEEADQLWTFPEARNTGMAIAGGPNVREKKGHWKKVQDELAVVWQREDDPLQVRFVPGTGTCLQTNDDAVRLLDEHDITTVLCFQILLNAVITTESPVNIDLDDLVRVLGFPVREADDRQEARQKIWRWIQNFDSLRVIGNRRGWPGWDPAELHSEDALVRIGGWALEPHQGSEEAPFVVSIEPGAWLKRHRNNRKLLPYIGGLKPLKCPTGKLVGAWSVSIGLALLQRWREVVNRGGAQGDSGYHDFTREELLTAFPPGDTVGYYLSGRHPKRAKETWNAAMVMLQSSNHKVVGSCESVTGTRVKRQGWQREWFEQQLRVEPAEDIRESLLEIRRRGNSGSGVGTEQNQY